MSPYKILVIDKCSDCTRIREGHLGEMKCDVTDESLRDINDIPDSCPLYNDVDGHYGDI